MLLSYAAFSVGVWSIGVATKTYSPEKELGHCSESWALQHDGKLIHNGEEQGKVSDSIDEGDVIVSCRLNMSMVSNNSIVPLVI